MHEPGGECTQGDQLLAVQRLNLVGLQPLSHIRKDHFAHRGAASKQRPKVLLGEAQQQRVLRCQDEERRVGLSSQQRRLAKAIASGGHSHHGPRAVRLRSLGANLALKHEPIETQGLPWLHQHAASVDFYAIHNLHAAQRAYVRFSEGTSAAQSLGDLPQGDRFNLDRLLALAHFRFLNTS